MWTNLVSITHFPDRDADHNSGLAAANWIRSQIEMIIKNSSRDDAKIFIVDTIGKDPWSRASFKTKQPLHRS